MVHRITDNRHTVFAVLHQLTELFSWKISTLDEP